MNPPAASETLRFNGVQLRIQKRNFEEKVRWEIVQDPNKTTSGVIASHCIYLMRKFFG